MHIADNSSTWENAVPAKSLLTVNGYNPIDYAPHINCPVFLVYGLRDQGIPLDDVERTANLIREVEHYAFDGDHFDAYDGGACIEPIVERQIKFLRKHLNS
jgi:pimeloyl-ACP methyl ester carboxylesterase